MITAKIIADSKNTSGDRLTTFILEYPRFIHAELLTHRVFSKNVSSSRAIPIDKMIEAVNTSPATPVYWGANMSGMQAKRELTNDEFVYISEYAAIISDLRLLTEDEFNNLSVLGRSLYEKIGKLDAAKLGWEYAKKSAVYYAGILKKTGLHKQIVNRVLEPFMTIRTILSGTEFGNFFALRAHPDAQPEFQALAYEMLSKYNQSIPKLLKPNDWHIPFGETFDEERVKQVASDKNISIQDAMLKIAIARCARVSYLNFEGKDDYFKDLDTCDKLFSSIPRHCSPMEHVAMALDGSEKIGNFNGFKQYRYLYSDQNLRDPRVIQNK